MRKKKIIGIILAAALVAGGLGGFAYANNNSHEPMTRQKLVGTGGCSVDDDAFFEGVLTFTNPDCVSEITIEQVSIIKDDGTVIHEGKLLDRVGGDWSMPLGPHEGGIIVLRDYVAWHEEIDPGAFREFPGGGYTVEIFWTKSHQQGLPLTGWSTVVILELGESSNVIIGLGPGWTSEMLNMEQKLKP